MKEEKGFCFVLGVVLFFILVNVGGVAAQNPDLVYQPLSWTPFAVAVDPTSTALFISDTINNRVLRVDNRTALTQGTLLGAVFGQPDFFNTTANYPAGSPSQSNLHGPDGLWVDAAGTLWVVDANNNRVVWYKNAATLGSLPLQSGVIGQPDFVSFSGSCLANRLDAPTGIHVDDSGILWVVDYNNNRVLRFDGATSSTFPTANATADGVIGQPSLTICGGSGGPSASSLSGPYGVFHSADGLYISEIASNRVTFWPESEARKSVGAVAAFVYGQSSLSSSVTFTGADDSFDTPIGLRVVPSLVAGGQDLLIVADTDAARIGIFPCPPTLNSLSALDIITTSQGPGFISYDAGANALWVPSSADTAVNRYSDYLPKLPPLGGRSLEVDFVGRRPAALLLPKDSNGNVDARQRAILIAPRRIEELHASNASIISSSAFPSFGYTLSQSIDSVDTQLFRFQTLISNYKVVVDYFLFTQPLNLSSAGVQFPVDSNTLKLSVTIERQNYTIPANNRTLRLHLSLNIVPPVTFISNSTNNTITTFLLYSSNVMTTTVDLLGAGLADGGNIVPVTSAVIFAGGSNINSSLDFVLDFPAFNSTFNYDPDFSVTVNPTDEGDGSSTDLLPLLALTSLIVIPLVFILLGAVVTTYLCYMKKRRREKLQETLHQHLQQM